MKPLIQTEYREPYNMPRQLLPDVFWQTGYVDAAWSDTILNKNSMTGDAILPLVIRPTTGSISIQPMTGAEPNACSRGRNQFR